MSAREFWEAVVKEVRSYTNASGVPARVVGPVQGPPLPEDIPCAECGERARLLGGDLERRLYVLRPWLFASLCGKCMKEYQDSFAINVQGEWR